MMNKRSTEKPPSLRRPQIGQDIHTRSPMLRRLERENLMSLVRKGARAVLIAGGLGVLAGAGGIAWAVFENSSSSSGSENAGPCSPAENKLDCLDRLYEEEQDTEPDGGLPTEIEFQELPSGDSPPPAENNEGHETPSAPAYPDGAKVPT